MTVVVAVVSSAGLNIDLLGRLYIYGTCEASGAPILVRR